MKFGDLLKEAYNKAGIALPNKEEQQTVTSKKKGKSKPKRQNITEANKKKTKEKKTGGLKSVVKSNKKNLRFRKKTYINKQHTEHVEEGIISYTKSGIKIIRNDLSHQVQKKEPTPSSKATPDPAGKHPVNTIPPRINVQPGAKIVWNVGTQLLPKILSWKQNGSSIELGETRQEKHLYLGLDFGTSTIKAVVHDKERDLSFAVPFRDLPGIQSYLLPCHLRSDEGVYSLSHGATVSQDLKLSFLAQPDNRQAKQHVVAFLALVLQQIRAWLLSEHSDKYNGSIIWSMTLGLPVLFNQKAHLAEPFKDLGTAAWIASTNNKISEFNVEKAIARAEFLKNNDDPDYYEDIEVDVKPEIAAQIYGFVSSAAYDPSARNIYLMVDIGAGTSDASIFHLKRNEKRPQQADFSIFKTSIEPYGVMNWHSERIEWLLTNMQEYKTTNSELLYELKKIQWITDSIEPVPNKLDGYFNNITIQKTHDQCPDKLFYDKVKKQIITETYMHCEQKNLIERAQLTGIPMFLCGGGSRIPMYKKLETDMKGAENYSWFCAIVQQLNKPESLQAPGIKHKDYDRLSVAFGLSQMGVGTITYEVPAIEKSSPANYQSRYISKDSL